MTIGAEDATLPEALVRRIREGGGRPGMEVDGAELVAVAREHLAKFKVPRTIHVVRELPRDENGRVVRSALGGQRH